MLWDLVTAEYGEGEEEKNNDQSSDWIHPIDECIHTSDDRNIQDTEATNRKFAVEREIVISQLVFVRARQKIAINCLAIDN